MIYYRNPARAAEMPAFKGATLRFHGKARIVESGPERDAVWAKTIPAEQGKDPEKKGVGIVVDVELIEDLLGTVVMKRD